MERGTTPDVTDYYCPRIVSSTIGYSMGRTVGVARVIRADAIKGT